MFKKKKFAKIESPPSLIYYMKSFLSRNKNPRRVLKKFENLLFEPTLFNPSKNDIYLVSFPKSGNTWVRLMLVNMFVKISGVKGVDFFNDSAKIIQDVHVDRHYKNILGDKFPRIVKSHSEYNRKYPKTILLTRDSRDVMVSYYNYLNYKGKNLMDFKKFIRSKKYGLRAWYKHYNSWKNNANLIIKYENLKKDCFSEMKKLVDFIGLKVDDELIRKAISDCDFYNLQKKECQQSKNSKKNAKFFNKGKSAQWKNYFDEEDLAYYKKIKRDFSK